MSISSTRHSDYHHHDQRRAAGHVPSVLHHGFPQMYDVWSDVLHLRAFMDDCNLWNSTLADAFFWANAADPTAQLCITE